MPVKGGFPAKDIFCSWTGSAYENTVDDPMDKSRKRSIERSEEPGSGKKGCQKKKETERRKRKNRRRPEAENFADAREKRKLGWSNSFGYRKTRPESDDAYFKNVSAVVCTPRYVQLIPSV